MRILWPIYRLDRDYSQYPGIMSMAALLARHGHDSVVVPGDSRAVAERLADKRPSILAFSTPSSHFAFVRDLNREVKRDFPDVYSVFGGPHPTFFPEMIEEEGVDAICIGEGEHALLELVEAREGGRSPAGIPNWWVKENGGIRRADVRPLLQDLDSLPVPDHNLFRGIVPWSAAQAIVVTSRGCPYGCTYCYNHSLRRIYRGKGKIIRRRSVAHVMRELEQVKALGCRFVRFMDDLFILSPEWVEEFSAEYRRRIGLPFSCLVRANHVTPEIMRWLKEAGCYRVTMGLEAGNDDVRNRILRRNMSREEIIRAADVIHESGLRLVTANILAIPGGSYAADWETLELNRRCLPDHPSVAILLPFPRTEIHDFAVREGFLDEQGMESVTSSFGFGLRSPLRFPDEGERRRAENLQKFFALAVRFPRLDPLVRRLVELPPNRFFDLVYKLASSWGINLRAMPWRIGLVVMLNGRRTAYLLRRRLRKTAAAGRER